jgi:hypothetical protein
MCAIKWDFIHREYQDIVALNALHFMHAEASSTPFEDAYCFVWMFSHNGLDRHLSIDYRVVRDARHARTQILIGP